MNVKETRPLRDLADTWTKSSSLVSVVIPVFNEVGSLREFQHRLQDVLGGLEMPYEMVFVDDGSHDGSVDVLREFASSPAVTLVELARNFGQHAAIFAGFEYARGDVIVTIDADLQNPPEEIPALLEQIHRGHDVVGGYRQTRRDPFYRRWASWGINHLIRRVLGRDIRDCGCMLRAYRREVVQRMSALKELSTFIPALALTFARNPIEIPVEHAERAEGRSKYSLWRLIVLQFDLFTGFSMAPLRLATLIGLLLAAVGISFSFFLAARRLIVGPEVEGVFTLFAILFFFVGLLFLGIGILGEYVGRIYAEIRNRPRFLVRGVVRASEKGDSHELSAFRPEGASPRGGS